MSALRAAIPPRPAKRPPPALFDPGACYPSDSTISWWTTRPCRGAKPSPCSNERRQCWYRAAMKLLLDESVPRRLASSFPKSFTVHTVQQMGWGGTGNGLLLSMAAREDFDAFITVDRGIEHQQNMSDLPLPIIFSSAAGLDSACNALPETSRTVKAQTRKADARQRSTMHRSFRSSQNVVKKSARYARRRGTGWRRANAIDGANATRAIPTRTTKHEDVLRRNRDWSSHPPVRYPMARPGFATGPTLRCNAKHDPSLVEPVENLAERGKRDDLALASGLPLRAAVHDGPEPYPWQ